MEDIEPGEIPAAYDPEYIPQVVAQQQAQLANLQTQLLHAQAQLAHAQAQIQQQPQVQPQAPQGLQVKIDPPKAFMGTKLDPSEVDNFIFQMDVYFQTETRIPAAQRGIVACGRLAGDAALWLQHSGLDLSVVTWDQLKQALRDSFKPLNWEARARNLLYDSQQGSKTVAEYTAAVRKAALQCGQVSAAELLTVFVRGLKAPLQREVARRMPRTIQEAIMMAEQDESAYDRFMQQRDGRQDAKGKGKATQRADSKSDDRRTGQAFRNNRGGRTGGSSSSGRTNGQKETRRCFNCGKIGHVAADCRAPKRQGGNGQPGQRVNLNALQQQVHTLTEVVLKAHPNLGQG